MLMMLTLEVMKYTGYADLTEYCSENWAAMVCNKMYNNSVLIF